MYYYSMVGITPRHREGIESQESYLAWLATVKDGTEVLLQKFHPANDSLLRFRFEHWTFSKARIHQDQYLLGGGESGLFDPSTGKAKYWDGKNDWGEVFPARILPIHYEFDAHAVKKVGDTFIGDLPLYEPLFLKVNRHVFRADSRSGSYHKFMREYPYSYAHTHKNSHDKLVEIFTEMDIEDVKHPSDLVFCYSEYLRD